MNSTNVTRQVLHGSLGRPVHILLVEDSPADVAMTVAALREGHIVNDMHVAGDGEEALDYLFRRGEFRDAPRPDLILLDLNLPKKDGCEVLAEVKADDDLKVIPVVVLTTSAAQSDVLRMYEVHANSYITKSVGFEQFLSALQHIETFWLTLARLSEGNGSSQEPSTGMRTICS
jgi:two-component system, chemotaxis family, response regulator Rcp1